MCVCVCNIFAYRFLYLYSLRHHQVEGRRSCPWHHLTLGSLVMQERGAGMTAAAGWPSRSICRLLFCLHLSTSCWRPPRWPAACQAPNPVRSCPSFYTWNTTSSFKSFSPTQQRPLFIYVNIAKKEKAFMMITTLLTHQKKDKRTENLLPGYISSVEGLIRPVGRICFAVNTERLLCGWLEVI